MATSLWQLFTDYKVEIPILQRDYAQGRVTGKVPQVRKRFLDRLCTALYEDSHPLELDFVYGYASQDMLFIPLDGQQRITTLFLLHWFLAVKEGQLDEVTTGKLRRFTYQTRHSSSVFCEKLAGFRPKLTDRKLKEILTDESWFFSGWEDDPTVNGMLTMLNDIQEKFGEGAPVWHLLTGDTPKIVFHLLPMGELGLPDELYIKMNSRGKELTAFEYFKSRFSELLPADKVVEFNTKIDQKWSDLFWNLYKDLKQDDIALHVDKGILRFFNYVTDLLGAKNNINIERKTEEFAYYRTVYMDNDNIKYLFCCLDKLSEKYEKEPAFFDQWFYEKNNFRPGKVRLFFNKGSVELFKKCSDNYEPTERQNPFSIGEQLMLFACIEHLVNDTSDFPIRIRILRNLITNSEDRLRKEELPVLLNAISDLILSGRINAETTRFQKLQAEEEVCKQSLINNGTLEDTTVHRLEDHELLQGCLAIFELNDNIKRYASVFEQLFNAEVHYETVSRALFSFGDYSQSYGLRRRLGNQHLSVWRELFTSSNRNDFANTGRILRQLLDKLINHPTTSTDSIVADYLEAFNADPKQPKLWYYYYIKYESCRKWTSAHTDGFYRWNVGQIEEPYNCFMMFKTTLNGRHWSPFLLTLDDLSNNNIALDDFGGPMVVTVGPYQLRMLNQNNGFILSETDETSELFLQRLRKRGILDDNNRSVIQQNDEGIDIEDRVEKGLQLLQAIQAAGEIEERA